VAQGCIGGAGWKLPEPPQSLFPAISNSGGGQPFLHVVSSEVRVFPASRANPHVHQRLHAGGGQKVLKVGLGCGAMPNSQQFLLVRHRLAQHWNWTSNSSCFRPLEVVAASSTACAASSSRETWSTSPGI